MRFLRKLHKWLGLLLGVQLILWLMSGLAMSLLDRSLVSGGSSAVLEDSFALLPADARVAEPAAVLAAYDAGSVIGLELTTLLQRWVWRVVTHRGAWLHDAT